MKNEEGWDHRVVRTEVKLYHEGAEGLPLGTEPGFRWGIYEVFYDESGKPTERTEEPIALDIFEDNTVGMLKDEQAVMLLRNDLESMRKALDRPVLTDADFPVKTLGWPPSS